MMDALLNAQQRTNPAPFKHGADGRPELAANLPPLGGPGGEPGAPGGVQIISWSDNGSSDAASLAGRSDADVAQDLIDQAGPNGQLSLADVLSKMEIDTTTDPGKDVAKAFRQDWNLMTHGRGNALSAADLTAAVQSYRKAHGDEVTAGGTAARA